MENSSKNEWFVGIPMESLMLNSRFTRRFKLLDTLISSRDQSEWTMPICGWFICWNDWSLYEYSRHPPYSNRLSQSVPTIYFLGWISMNMNECEWILITMDWSGLLYTYIMFICLFMYVSCIWISIDPWLNMNEHGFSHDFPMIFYNTSGSPPVPPVPTLLVAIQVTPDQFADKLGQVSKPSEPEMHGLGGEFRRGGVEECHRNPRQPQ